MKRREVSASNSDGRNSNPPFQTVQTVISGSGRGARTDDSKRSIALNPNPNRASRSYGEGGVCFRPLTPPCPVSDYSDHSDGFFRRVPDE